MRRLVCLLATALTLSATAEALTIRDVIELSRAGLGEDVLLALIDVDRGVYAIDTKTLKALKEAGVSEKVIVALVRSGREQTLEPPPTPVFEEEPLPPPPAQVVVIDHRDDHVREVAVPVPVFVPVAIGNPQFRSRRFTRPTVDPTSTFVPFQSGPPVARPQVVAPKQPVYWGFGGKLRPDAWNPEPPKPPRQEDRRRDH
jgi:hypothetical protein